MTFVDELRTRAGQIRTELETQRAIAKEANERIAELQADLTAVLRLYEKEPKGSHKPEPHLVKPIPPLPQPTAADVVRAILRDAPQGLTPKQIRDAMRQRGVKVNSNYVYRFLYRYKANGKVEERGGKYSLISVKAAAAS